MSEPTIHDACRANDGPPRLAPPVSAYRRAVLDSLNETRDRLVYPTEAAAVAVANEITARWEVTDGDAGYRAYAGYSVSRGGWVVRRRPYYPGTCT